MGPREPLQRVRVPAHRTRDIDAMLRALDVEELRAFLRESLARLDHDVREQLEDALERRAATRGGFRRAAPEAAIVDEAVDFARTARRVGFAEPSAVDHYLRSAITASLAGEHAAACRIFEALLVPIADAEIDLGQHEMVEEVLSVDLEDCVARYMLAIFMEAEVTRRAEAVLFALESMHGVGGLVAPVAAMERALGCPLPDADAFLEVWIARLETRTRADSDWDNEEDRWLREAVDRRHGAEGLARLARTTKRAEAARAWCDAVVREGDWKRALTAYEEAATIVVSPVWRGDFLDGAALAAKRLEHKRASAKLEAAWLGAPSLARLLRWLLADDAPRALVRKRAKQAIEACPTDGARLRGLLHLLLGQREPSARALADAPGLGWSSDDHPGHVVFPSFAWILSAGKPAHAAATCIDVLREAPHSLTDISFESLDLLHPTPAVEKLATPAVLDTLARAEANSVVNPSERNLILDAMRAAARKRVDGVTGEKRRRHYGHAAMLVACCVALDAGAAASAWLAEIRARTSRFPAFREELAGALGVFDPRAQAR